jgi:uncharacterized protein YdaU (DUF1376 family)
MAAYPALPFWTDAYMADCGHLTDAEHGRYCLLLIEMWRAPDCRLPNDLAWLARKFRRPIEKIEEDLMPLVREFCDVDGNWITQKRLRREWKYLKEQSKNQSDRAKARWEKKKGECRADAGDTPPAYAASGNAPTPTPTPPINSTSGKAVSADKRGRRLSGDWQPSAADRAFAADHGLDPDFTAHEFRDYWTAVPGAKGRKTDWSATFRNRCRDLAGRPGRTSPRSSPSGGWN